MTQQQIENLRADFPWPSEIPDMPYNLEGWCDWSLTEEIKKKIQAVLDKKDYCLYAEVGSWFGCSGNLAAQTVGNRGHVICMDHWAGGGEFSHNEKVATSYDQFVRNLWEYQDIVTPVKLASPECLIALKKYGIEPDVLCIDGSHLYEDVKLDLTFALNLFPNTVIFGHDYDPDWRGVQKAVYDVLTERKLQYVVNKITWTVLQ